MRFGLFGATGGIPVVSLELEYLKVIAVSCYVMMILSIIRFAMSQLRSIVRHGKRAIENGSDWWVVWLAGKYPKWYDRMRDRARAEVLRRAVIRRKADALRGSW